MNRREKLCAWMFEVSKTPYAFLFKRNKKAWGLNSDALLKYPDGSLGKGVGEFLKTNGFELIDKLESHDVYHVITDTDTDVKSELGMQFLLLGNWKRSFYQFTTVTISHFLLPEHLKYFRAKYIKGKTFKGIHKLNLYEELNNQLDHIRWRLQKSNTHHKMKYFNLINDQN